MRNAVAISLVLAAAASCFSPVIDHQCTLDADCGSGWVCIATMCQPGEGGQKGGGSGTTGGGSGTTGGSSGTTGGGTGTGGAGTGGGGGAACTPTNCLRGCCAGDVCIPTTNQNVTNCGNAGNQCLTCSNGAICKDGACFGGTCDSTSCPAGCCLQSQCVPTASQNQFACGVGGGLCAACGTNNSCVSGRCVARPCDSQTCPNGCCSQGTCIPTQFQSAVLCGRGGNACASCAGGQTCSSGACVASMCNASTCPNGCCVSGVCVPFAAQSTSLCGRMGATCSVCPSGNVCTSGQCLPQGCGPSTCSGCCGANGCARGDDTFACGVGGQLCRACLSTQQCIGGTCVGCGPSTCPSGCCQNGVCTAGTSNQQCGIGGQVCATCAVGSTCQFQRCTTTGQTVGTACTNDVDCSSLGMGAICKRITTSGNAVYQGGYCTLRCNTPGTCPGQSTCTTLSAFGEADRICLASCGAVGACRQPGYTCYTLGPMQGGCWISPLPGLDGGIFIDAGFPPDAGGGQRVGGPCASDLQCQPPAGATCLPPVIGGQFSTGYLGGYCTRACSAGAPCPSGAVCITEVFGMSAVTSCKEACFQPGMGQGTCRSGYICISSPTGLGGWCGPRCTNQTVQCPSGGTCNIGTGYCQ